MLLLDRFFDGTFFTYGIEVMSFADRDQEDRIGKCLKARPCLYFFPTLSKFYQDFIQISSRFYLDFWKTHLIQILSIFFRNSLYLSFIQILSVFYLDKSWIKSG